MFINTNLKKLVIPAISTELLRLEKTADQYTFSKVYQRVGIDYASGDDHLAACKIASSVIHLGLFVNVLRFASIYTDAQHWGARVEECYLDLIKCEARLSGTNNPNNNIAVSLAVIRQKQCQELLSLFNQLALNIIDAGYTYHPEV